MKKRVPEMKTVALIAQDVGEVAIQPLLAILEASLLGFIPEPAQSHPPPVDEKVPPSQAQRSWVLDAVACVVFAEPLWEYALQVIPAKNSYKMLHRLS